MSEQVLTWGRYVPGIDDRSPLVLGRVATIKDDTGDATPSIVLDGAETELERAVVEASETGWDGQGATPVMRATYLAAKRFLAALPTSLPQPEVSADPDGEIAFDWLFKPKIVLSVSVSATGKLSYSALFGEASVCGEEFLIDSIPGNILGCLHRCMAMDQGHRTAG